MPTNRRRYTRGRRGEMAELTAELRFALERGNACLVDDPGTLTEAWEMHRDQILEEWEVKQPGTRPWAWWEYDAPEPRRVVNAPPEGSSLLAESTKRAGQVYIGDGGEPVEMVPWLEEEADYLARLGLD